MANDDVLVNSIHDLPEQYRKVAIDEYDTAAGFECLMQAFLRTRSKDKAPGIDNDPDAWGEEHDDPRYILDLIKRITTLSVETVKIVNGPPSLEVLGA